MFFIAVFNIYIFCLVYLNWPTDYISPMTLHEHIEMQEVVLPHGKKAHKDKHKVPNGYYNPKIHGKVALETQEEESKTDQSHVVVTGSREIKIEF